MRLKIIVIAFITLAVLATAQAEPRAQYRYRWSDASGVAHYSDSLTREAIKNGYDIINENGVVISHIERTLTPAERIAREKAERKAAAERREARQQAFRDQQMLAAYPKFEDYAASQKALVDTIASHIYTTKANLRSQEQNLAALLAKAAETERQGKPVPGYMTSRIAERRTAVNEQRALAKRQQAQKVAAEHLMQANLDHYRDLRAKQKAAASAASAQYPGS